MANSKNHTANNINNEAEAPLQSKNGVAKQSRSRTFPIVCIGGSAGAFEGLEKFFTHMSPDSGMAFVVIMHLDKNHAGSVSELLQNYTSMPVTEAGDGMLVEQNHVYMIPTARFHWSSARLCKK